MRDLRIVHAHSPEGQTDACVGKGYGGYLLLDLVLQLVSQVGDGDWSHFIIRFDELAAAIVLRIKSFFVVRKIILKY